MNKILLTMRLSQDEDGAIKSDRSWDRQFWIKTKSDLAWVFDTVEIEAHKLFQFADEGVTATFEKEGVNA